MKKFKTASLIVCHMSSFTDINGRKVRDGDILEIDGEDYVLLEFEGKWYITRDIDHVEEIDLNGLKDLRAKVVGNVLEDFYGVTYS